MYSKSTQTTETHSIGTDPQKDEKHTEPESSLKKQQSQSLQREEENHEKQNNQKSNGLVVRDLNANEKQALSNDENLGKFVSRSSKIIERALFVDSHYDVLVDYAKEDSTSKYLNIIQFIF